MVRQDPWNSVVGFNGGQLWLDAQHARVALLIGAAVVVIDEPRHEISWIRRRVVGVNGFQHHDVTVRADDRIDGVGVGGHTGDGVVTDHEMAALIHSRRGCGHE